MPEPQAAVDEAHHGHEAVGQRPGLEQARQDDRLPLAGAHDRELDRVARTRRAVGGEVRRRRVLERAAVDRDDQVAPPQAGGR